MKNAITSAILAGGLIAAGAGSALAANAAYCDQQARQAVWAYTHPAGTAVVGCVAGGILGNILSNGNAGATAGGCAVGGATAIVITENQRQKVYNDAYYSCMGSGGGGGYAPGPQPIVAGPPQSGSASNYQQLNVRSGPSTDYAVVYKLPPYSTVAVSQCTATWCAVGDGNSVWGWASRKYLFFN